MFPEPKVVVIGPRRGFLFASRVVAVLNGLFLIAMGWRLGLLSFLHLEFVQWIGVAGYLLAPVSNIVLHIVLMALLMMGRLGQRKGIYLFNFVMLIVELIFLMFFNDSPGARVVAAQ